MTRRVLLRGALLADVAQRRLQPGELLVADGRIVELGERIAVGSETEVRDLTGLVLSPGFVDLHVHLREPGFEHKETVKSGTRAAAAGGFTTVCCMPNTQPVLDNAETLGWLQQRIAQDALVKVLPIAAISLGSLGQQATDFIALVDAGACAFSDDGRGVMNSRLMLTALQASRQLGVPVIAHEEDSDLARGGSINAGPVSEQLGDPGIPGVAEYAMIARDIYLAELADAHLHVAHVSCAESVDLVRRAKARGLRVTAEATPHHLALTDAIVPELQGQAKVNPPLRSEGDRMAICAGLADGTIDAIATDHAPHAWAEKQGALAAAAFGFTGLETAFAVSYQQLVLTAGLPLIELLAALTIRPAEVLRLPVGRLAVGAPADLVALDLAARYRLRAEDLRSSGRNTPFLGRDLCGQVAWTMVDGKTVYQRSGDHASC